MARGFNTTLGSASTDRIKSALASHNNLRSYACWAYRNGAGGGSNGRMFDKRVSSGQIELMYFNGTNTEYVYARKWTGNATAPEWGFAAPATGAWRHVVFTYDATSTANDAVGYLDGISQTIVERLAVPSGSPDTNTDAYVIGNRENDNARAWDGMLAEFAAWNVVLDADQALALARGCSPLLIEPAALVEYVPMIGPANSYVAGATSITGTAIQPHPRMWYSGRRRIYLPAAAGGSGVSATLSVTESADTSSASGNVAVAATAAVTEAADTSAASGVVAITGAGSVTEAADTATASGTVGSSAVTGSISATEAADTATASAVVAASAALSATESSDTATATATIAVAGSLSATESADTLSSSGTVATIGGPSATLSATEAADTQSGAGAVAISASLSATEAADTAVGIAQIQIVGGLSATESADTLSGSATAGGVISGSAALTEEDDTAAFYGLNTTPNTTAVSGGGRRRMLRVLPDMKVVYADDREIVQILKTFYQQEEKVPFVTREQVRASTSPDEKPRVHWRSYVARGDLVEFDSPQPKFDIPAISDLRRVPKGFDSFAKSLQRMQKDEQDIEDIMRFL